MVFIPPMYRILEENWTLLKCKENEWKEGLVSVSLDWRERVTECSSLRPTQPGLPSLSGDLSSSKHVQLVRQRLSRGQGEEQTTGDCLERKFHHN